MAADLTDAEATADPEISPSELPLATRRGDLISVDTRSSTPTGPGTCPAR